MVAVIDARDREWIERVVPGHLTARVLEDRPILPRHLTRADRIQKHVDAHAGSAALGQRGRHLAGDGAVLVEKIGERDRGLRAADRGEHCGEDLIAVQQDLGAIAVDGT